MCARDSSKVINCYLGKYLDRLAFALSPVLGGRLPAGADTDKFQRIKACTATDNPSAPMSNQAAYHLQLLRLRA